MDQSHDKSMRLTPQQIENVREYLMDLECPFDEEIGNAICDMALASSAPPTPATGETPRTDAEAKKSDGDYYLEDTVPVDFARQLERELAHMNQVYASACVRVVRMGVPAFGTLDEGLDKLAAQRSAIAPTWKLVAKPEGKLALKPGQPGYCIVNGQWWRFDVPHLPHTCRDGMYFDPECASCVADQAHPTEIAPTKPLGYCIMAADGRMYWEEGCISTDKGELSGALESLQDDEPDDGWAIVPFYADTFRPDWANFKQGRADGFAEGREVTDELVKRFLQWPVPASVYPDGIPGQPGRTGTNLLSAIEARAMLEFVLDQSPVGDKPELPPTGDDAPLTERKPT